MVERRVLLVEDSEPLARAYEGYLRRDSFDVVIAEDGAQALAELAKGRFDAVVLDLILPDVSGLEILRSIQGELDPPKVIVITIDGQIRTAVEAMREGAFDFLVKPFNAERLIAAIRAAADRRAAGVATRAPGAAGGRRVSQEFVGDSPIMRQVYTIIKAAAASDATIFITGESGTGKELCAEAVHRQSQRRRRPMVAINCAAIPKDLVESEIFGHVKGAFTGAVADRDGAATSADGGTLFLDEICEMPFDLQAKLLRFVETGTFTRVGDTRLSKVDVRFICATNRDPQQEVAATRFREDLFYRLHVVPIHMPALREHTEDILPIAQRFLESFSRAENRHFRSFSPAASAALTAYRWPGNVRELQNVVRNLVVLHDGEIVDPSMLGLGATQSRPNGAMAEDPPATPADDPAWLREGTAIEPMWRIEKQYIERALALAHGNVAKAAAMLEISPSTIYRKRQSWRENAGG